MISTVAAAGLAAAAIPAASAAAGAAVPSAVPAIGSAPSGVGSPPAWFTSPLTAAQVRAEVAIPRRPASVHGPLRATRAVYTTESGRLAVPAAQADGQTLIAGEALVLDGSGLFALDSTRPSASAHAELGRLTSALRYVTGVTCEGHTAYDGHGTAAAAHHMSQSRAAAICSLVHQLDPAARTTAVGYGPGRPVLVGGTFGQRIANRRTVLVVTSASVALPAAPAITSTTSADGAATAAFTPSAGGPLPISGYQYSFDGGATWRSLAVTGSSPLVGSWTGLTNGETYRVEIRAVDAAGFSAPSAPATLQPAAPSIIVPGAPVITADTTVVSPLAPNDFIVTLTFTRPSSDGGSPITGYEYSQQGGPYIPVSVANGASSDSMDIDTTIPHCSFQGTKTYTIKALNANGASAASNVWPVTLDDSANCS